MVFASVVGFCLRSGTAILSAVRGAGSSADQWLEDLTLRSRHANPTVLVGSDVQTPAPHGLSAIVITCLFRCLIGSLAVVAGKKRVAGNFRFIAPS